MPFSSSGVLLCASTIISANPLTGAVWPFWVAILPASTSYMSLIAAFCMKSVVARRAACHQRQGRNSGDQEVTHSSLQKKLPFELDAAEQH